MVKKKSKEPKGSPIGIVVVIVGLLLACIGLVVFNRSDRSDGRGQASPSAPAPPTSPLAADEGGQPPTRDPSDPTMEMMETSKAVMVTVELDFGGTIPPIADAVKEIERVSTPLDGQGRTFAVLDAYGEPTPDGKLHLSMHVSSEKPGTGSLIFKRTGEVLWKSRIVQGPPATSPYAGKKLIITIDESSTSAFPIDVSNGAKDILDANIPGRGKLVRDFWKDGEERTITFYYSTCGCPVKVQARRVGDRIVRLGDKPLLFPDDPQAVVSINGILKW